MQFKTMLILEPCVVVFSLQGNDTGLSGLFYHLHGETVSSMVCANDKHKCLMAIASSVRIDHLPITQKPLNLPNEARTSLT